MTGRATGVVASAAFAALAVSPKLLGTAAYAEHFVLLPAVGGLLVLLRAAEARRRGWLVASGLLLGVALLMKQSGGVFAAGAAAYVLLGRAASPPPAGPERLRAAVVLLLAALVPFATVCLLLLAAGTFGTFWFWTFAYAAEYAGQGPSVHPGRQKNRPPPQAARRSRPAGSSAHETPRRPAAP